MKKGFTLTVLLLCSSMYAATFTSVASGAWNNPANWSIVGVDPNGVPDSNDDVFISAGHTISLAGASVCRDLTTNPGGIYAPSSFTLSLYGDLTNNGTISGINGNFVMIGAATVSGNSFGCGTFNFQHNCSIAVGCTVNAYYLVNVSANRTLTNNGTLNCFSAGNCLRVFAGGTLTNANGSILRLNGIVNIAGTLNAATPTNTVIYMANQAQDIHTAGTTYYNLTLSSASPRVKSLTGAISVVNDFLISSRVTFNMASNVMFLGGNWTNNANTNCTNMNQIIFVGTGTQTITRNIANTENFASLVMGGTGTVMLADSIFVNGALDISSGTFDVSASNFSVRVRGNLSDNATFNTRQGTVFMAGTVAQTIDGFSNTTFYNLHCTNAAGVTIPNFAKSLTNILTVAAGPFGTSGTGTLTLLASAATTAARVAPLGATASLVGTGWIIQTYIDGPATAYWQYLGSPTSTSTLADWDGDTRFYMSGVGGNDGNACCPVFRSVRTYNEPTNTYTNITTTATALTPARGFMVWMSDNMTGLTAPLIFDTRGTPNFNTVNRAVTAGGAGGGYNLVSNPMPSPINYATVVSLSSATLSANFVILQESGSYVTNPNGGTIATAQGFMCIASTAGNITFDETCKSTTANPNVVRMLAGNEIRIKVGNEVNGLGEEAVVKLNPGGDESLNLAVDLPYLASPYDNATHVYTQNSSGEQFLLNNLGTESDHLMIPVNIETSTPGIQTITFKDLNTVTEYNCAWLEDLTTGAKVNLNQTDTYSFEEAEMGLTRNFILHFERTNDCSFDLQNSVASLDAQTNVYVSGEQIFAQFEFETEEIVTISMFDLGGRMVMGETTMNVGTQTIALQNPDAHGIYLVRIQKGNEVSTKKIYY